MNAPVTLSPRFEHPPGKVTLLHTSHWLPAPIEEVFDFFSRPENLQRLTPPRLSFEILTPPPIEMRRGCLIDYRLKLHGIPISWRSLISDYDPPHRFTDEQLKGPYRMWIHTHSFYAEANGTRVEDQVKFQVPGGRLIEKMVVQKNLAEIFRYRHQTLDEIYNVRLHPADNDAE